MSVGRTTKRHAVPRDGTHEEQKNDGEQCKLCRSAAVREIVRGHVRVVLSSERVRPPEFSVCAMNTENFFGRIRFRNLFSCHHLIGSQAILIRAFHDSIVPHA